MSVALVFYSIFFALSWLYPTQHLDWQQFSYIGLAIALTMSARLVGIDIELFLFIYLAKSYFLLGRRTTLLILYTLALPWVAIDYGLQTGQIPAVQAASNDSLDPHHLLKFGFFSLITYAAAGVLTVMISAMVVAEQQHRQRIEELTQQVEGLAATLERTRIAREIHDSLGHTLTDLDMQLAVAQRLRSHNPEQAFQAIDTAKMLSGQCIEDVSQALDRMRRSNFDLNQALTALIEQVRHNSNLQVQFEVNLPQFSVHKSYQIYCIVKEGIINIQKHAHASQISFYGQLTVEGILLDLKDDGVGFDPTTLSTGFGIRGMMERSQLLGGKLELKTAPAQGTQIQVLLPP
ncbi:MAG TPA: sensor histidine kinase [Coleofasciculaceae cyanobacterium]